MNAKTVPADMARSSLERVGVVGATGPTGRCVVQALQDPRAGVGKIVKFSRSATESSARFDPAGPLDAMVRAFVGLDALYVIPPRLHPEEHILASRVFRAAEQANVGRVVFHSVMHPDATSVPHHRRKAEAEAMLRGTGLRWSILRPNTYAQNYLRRVARVERGLVLLSPWRSDGPPLAPVDLEDVAAAAVLLLHGRTSFTQDAVPTDYGTFEAAGPDLVDNVGAARLLGQAWNTVVTALEISVADHLPDGIGMREREDSEKYFAHYGKHGFPGSPATLTALLRRRPCSLGDIARREGLPTPDPASARGRTEL